jgi:hypothetical protein
MNESFNGGGWEPVCGGTVGDTWRMRLAGGWIYRYDTWTQDGSGKVSSRHSAMVFVPDPTEPQRQLHARTDAESLVCGCLTSPILSTKNNARLFGVTFKLVCER